MHYIMESSVSHFSILELHLENLLFQCLTGLPSSTGVRAFYLSKSLLLSAVEKVVLNLNCKPFQTWTSSNSMQTHTGVSEH